MKYLEQEALNYSRMWSIGPCLFFQTSSQNAIDRQMPAWINYRRSYLYLPAVSLGSWVSPIHSTSSHGINWINWISTFGAWKVLQLFEPFSFTWLEVLFLTMEVLLFVEQVRSKGFGKRGDDFPQKLLWAIETLIWNVGFIAAWVDHSQIIWTCFDIEAKWLLFPTS